MLYTLYNNISPYFSSGRLIFILVAQGQRFSTKKRYVANIISTFFYWLHYSILIFLTYSKMQKNTSHKKQSTNEIFAMNRFVYINLFGFMQKEINMSLRKMNEDVTMVLICLFKRISVNTEEEMKNDLQKEVEDSSCSSSEWQVVEVQEEKPRDVISRELLQRDEETLGKDRDDAMAEEFDERRKYGFFESLYLCC